MDVVATTSVAECIGAVVVESGARDTDGGDIVVDIYGGVWDVVFSWNAGCGG